MKIALAQLNYVIGDFERNVFKIKEQINKAKADKVDLVVFAELSVCGYPPLDFLEFKDFISQCEKAVVEIAAECIGIAAIVGAPSINPVPEGKNLFNSAYYLTDGKIKKVVSKSLLPNYDVFDEYRYFEPNRSFENIELNGATIALPICEDLWNVDDDPLYILFPMDELKKGQPQLMINIAASPFDYAHAEERKSILRKNVLKYNLPLIYLNHVGAQTELIFDGGSFVMNADGEVVCELKYFEEDFQVMEFIVQSSKFTVQKPDLSHQVEFEKNKTVQPSHQKQQRIHDALILGIKDYFQKQNFSKAIIGLSGGIDSALVTVLATEALGANNVKVVMMPSQFSSQGSVDDSIALAKNLGVEYEIIPIENIFNQYSHSLEQQFKGLPFNVAEENLQARIRGSLLMAMSNKFGYILLNTSNKSELAVGYGTLYGDMCGGLSVIGDVYKTEVYQLCNYINKEKEIIPKNILTKAPSAELRPNQKDSDSLPDYSILDKVLFEYIEHRNSPQELVAMGFEEALVKRILKLVNTNEYKRFQFPPILRISSKAFGMGRRMPIVGKYLS